VHIPEVGEDLGMCLPHGVVGVTIRFAGRVRQMAAQKGLAGNLTQYFVCIYSEDKMNIPKSQLWSRSYCLSLVFAGNWHKTWAWTKEWVESWDFNQKV